MCAPAARRQFKRPDDGGDGLMCQHEFFGNFLATDWVFTGQLQVYFVRDTA